MSGVLRRSNRCRSWNEEACWAQGDGWLLLQLRVLCFGLLIDGDVWVGIFPEGEEIFVSSRFLTTTGRMIIGSPASSTTLPFSFRGIALHDISPGELQASQCDEG